MAIVHCTLILNYCCLEIQNIIHKLLPLRIIHVEALLPVATIHYVIVNVTLHLLNLY